MKQAAAMIEALQSREKVRPVRELPLIAWFKDTILKTCKNRERIKRQEFFEKAQSVLVKEIDIVRLVRSQRLLRSLSKLLFSQRERKLMRTQAEHCVIHSKTKISASDSASDKDKTCLISLADDARQGMLSGQEITILCGNGKAKLPRRPSINAGDPNQSKMPLVEDRVPDPERDPGCIRGMRDLSSATKTNILHDLDQLEDILHESQVIRTLKKNIND